MLRGSRPRASGRGPVSAGNRSNIARHSNDDSFCKATNSRDRGLWGPFRILGGNVHSALAELNSRGVLKVATAYLAVCWLVLEIGHTLFAIFELTHLGSQIGTPAIFVEDQVRRPGTSYCLHGVSVGRSFSHRMCRALGGGAARRGTVLALTPGDQRPYDASRHRFPVSHNYRCRTR
jgi:hypothetical protein